MSDYQFRFLDPKDFPNWDRFVDESPQGSIYAKSFYLEACDKPFQIAVLEKSDEFHAGIVLARNELRQYGNPMLVKHLGVLLRPLDGNYCNNLTTEIDLTNQLLDHLGKMRSFNYTFHPEFKNWLPFYWRGYKQELRYTYQIRDLSSIENLLANMRARTRRDLKKADKNNITISQDISVEQLYDLIDKSFRRQGAPPPYSRQFIHRYCDTLLAQNALKIYGAVDESGHIHACAGIIFDQDSSNLVLSGVDHEKPNVGANTKLIWACIQDAASTSKVFDFEGSMIEQIESYYRGFGGELTPYYAIWRPGLITGVTKLAIKVYKKLRYGR